MKVLLLCAVVLAGTAVLDASPTRSKRDLIGWAYNFILEQMAAVTERLQDFLNSVGARLGEMEAEFHRLINHMIQIVGPLKGAGIDALLEKKDEILTAVHQMQKFIHESQSNPNLEQWEKVELGLFSATLYTIEKLLSWI